MDRDIRAELELRTAEAENLLDVHISQAKVRAWRLNRLKRTQKLQDRNILVRPAEEKVNRNSK